MFTNIPTFTNTPTTPTPVSTGPPQLSLFMQAIREQESGGNYASVNSSSGAAGAYQFMPSTWQNGINALGIQAVQQAQQGGYYSSPVVSGPGGTIVAPAAFQDAVAANLMTAYYNNYHNWYSVAEAWYGGPGAVGNPGTSGGGGYPSVGQYAGEVMAKMQSLGGNLGTSATAAGQPLYTKLFGGMLPGLFGAGGSSSSTSGGGIFSSITGGFLKVLGPLFEMVLGIYLIVVGFRLLMSDLAGTGVPLTVRNLTSVAKRAPSATKAVIAPAKAIAARAKKSK